MTDKPVWGVVGCCVGMLLLGVAMARAGAPGEPADSQPASAAHHKAAAGPSGRSVPVAGTALVKAQGTWRQSMLRHPQSANGCFKASYPSETWQTVQCVAAPTYPQGPRLRVPHPTVVGNGTDDVAALANGPISSTTGSFDLVQGVSGIAGGPGSVSNFALQVNTNQFRSPACSTSPAGSGCMGWEQFLYSNMGFVYIQYWRLNYNKACPKFWTAGPGGCFFNSPAISVPVQSVGNLANLTLTGAARLGGRDYATVTTSKTEIYTVGYYDNVLTLSQGWSGAEFNIVGDGNGSQTNLSSKGAIQIKVRIEVTKADVSSQSAPICVPNNFTGSTAETNNLNLVNDCGQAGTSSIAFLEVNGPVITGISPTHGPANGGTTVAISGGGFTGTTSLTFDAGAPTPTAVPFKVLSDTAISAISPACTPLGCPQGTGGERIVVTTPIGVGGSPAGYIPDTVVTGVVPPIGQTGNRVTVTGNGFFNFGPSPTFAFGGVPATDVVCAPFRNTRCTMTVPVGMGEVDVQQTDTRDPTKDSATGSKDKFTYIAGVGGQCQFSEFGCPAQGGTQSYTVACPSVTDFTVDGQFQTEALQFTGQEAGARQTTHVTACTKGTRDCVSFDTTSTQTCPIHGPPVHFPPVGNCRACTETGRKCVPVDGGYQCVGNAQ